MTLTTHATIGAVIGVATGNVFLAFLFGAISHFLVDIIPHGDREMYDGHVNKTAQRRALAFVSLDAIVAIIVISLMFAFSEHTMSAVIAAGIIGAVIPDMIIGMHEILRIRSLDWFHKLHFFFHNMISDKWGDIPLKHALAGQFVIVVFLQRFF